MKRFTYNSENIVVALSEIGTHNAERILVVSSVPVDSRQKVHDSLSRLVERRPGHTLKEIRPGTFVVGYPSGQYSIAASDASVPTLEELRDLAEIAAREVLPVTRHSYGATAVQA